MKNKFMNALSNLVAILWFVGMLLPLVLCLWFIPLGLFMDIGTIRTSGFSTVNSGFTMFGAFGLMFAITMIVPWFRKCFKKLPWLYSYVIVFMADILIIAFGILILNYGYEVQSESRHTLFYIIMLVQIIVCRLAMCVYLKWKPLNYTKEQRYE